MKWVEPRVFKIAETRINHDNLVEFLRSLNADDWLERQPWYTSERLGEIDHSATTIEIAGRACYKSFGVGLNPNITKIREDSRTYLENVMKKGDGSILEHSSASFALTDVSRVFCYSADTEVLTEEGWKMWHSVRGDERFASMTPERELVYVPAEERFVADYDGPMYQVRSQQVDLLVTPNHRMWVQKVDTQAYRRDQEPFRFHLAKDILHRRVRYQKGGVWWRGETPLHLAIPGTDRRWKRKDRPDREVLREYDGVRIPSAPFARFLGFYLSEGYLGSDTSINLTQTRGPVLDEMVSTVAEMGASANVVRSGDFEGRRLRFKNVALYDWLESNCGRGAINKRTPPPLDSWSPALIREFMVAMIKGDGNVHRSNGHEVIYTSSPQLADELQILALKMGGAANIRVDRRVESHKIVTGQIIRKTRPNYIVSFIRTVKREPWVNTGLTSPWPNRYRLPNGYLDQMMPYSGKVYCVKVKHGLLHVRRNGKACWSGNTHELVRHRAGTAISQESLRYVRQKELRMTLVPGSELANMEDREELTRALEEIERQYLAMAEMHIRQEMSFDAKKAWTSALRRMLPDGIATNIVWTANHRTLRWVLEMRTAPGAEVEMRYVFNQVGKILKRDHPLLYGDFETKPHEDGVGAQWIPRLRSKV